MGRRLGGSQGGGPCGLWRRRRLHAVLKHRSRLGVELRRPGTIGDIQEAPKRVFPARRFARRLDGLKGHRVGNAQISHIHANIMVNLGGAKAKDVRELISVAQKAVREKFNQNLQPEIGFIGEF